MALTRITTDGITDGSIINVDINASAAIASSKISGLVGGATGVDFNDNVKARWGTGNDLEIYHDATNSIIDNKTGDLYIKSVSDVFITPGTTEAGVYIRHNGAVELYFDDSKKLNTESWGVQVTGALQCSSHFSLGDDDKIKIGHGEDFQIYHDGTDSYISNTTGDLKIGGYSDDLYLFAADDIIIYTQASKKAVSCIGDGAVELYHNNVKKFETTSVGVTVSGNAFFPDNYGCQFGNAAGSSDLKIYHDGSHSRIIDSGTGNLMLQSDRLVIAKADNSENMLVCDDDTSVELYYDNSLKFQTTSAGAHVWGNLDFMDNAKVRLGTNTDLQIFHDGTNSRIYNNTGSLFFRANDFYFQDTTGDENLAKFIDNGACELYYDNSKKAETYSNGFKINGQLQCEGDVKFDNPDNAGRDIRWDSSDDTLEFSDQTKASFGDSNDLQIFHSTDNRFDSYGQNVRFVNKNTDGGVTENMLTMSPNGAVNLYHDGNWKCASTADGFEVGDFGTAGDVYGTEVRVDGGVRTSTATTAFQYMTRFYNPNGQVGYINVQNSATNYNTNGSDRDLKKNFESWDEDVLSLFKKVNPQKFNFKTEEDSTAKTKGFIAQEMVDSFPEAYAKNPAEGEDAKYYYNPSGMVVYLTKALQEAITKIETLETKVAALGG